MAFLLSSSVIYIAGPVRALCLSSVSSPALLSAATIKLNILSFALASDARDSHTPVSDQGESGVPPSPTCPAYTG